MTYMGGGKPIYDLLKTNDHFSGSFRGSDCLCKLYDAKHRSDFSKSFVQCQGFVSKNKITKTN